MFGNMEIPEVVYKGEKIFENYEKKVKVFILNHEELHCIELIVLGVSFGNKAVRMYLNSAVLVTKVDLRQFNTTLEIKRDAANRLRKPFDAPWEMKRIVLNMLAVMLIDRLQIIPSVFVNEFDVYFEPQDDDVIITNIMRDTFQPRLDFEFERKPVEVTPFKVIQTIVVHKR
jgi:hypothetical protein